MLCRRSLLPFRRQQATLSNCDDVWVVGSLLPFGRKQATLSNCDDVWVVGSLLPFGRKQATVPNCDGVWSCGSLLPFGRKQATLSNCDGVVVVGSLLPFGRKQATVPTAGLVGCPQLIRAVFGGLGWWIRLGGDGQKGGMVGVVCLLLKFGYLPKSHFSIRKVEFPKVGFEVRFFIYRTR